MFNPDVARHEEIAAEARAEERAGAEALEAELVDEIERLRTPIDWQDIRLHAGEGKLSAEAVLQAANAVIRNR